MSDKLGHRTIRIRRFVAIPFAFLLSACTVPAANYVDASAEERFEHYVGSSRTSSAELLLLGIDSYPSEERIKYYILMPHPGIHGRHVLSRSILPPGAEIKVVGAKRCTNCIGGSDRLLLEVPSIGVDGPIYLNFDFAKLLAESNGKRESSFDKKAPTAADND